MTAIAEASRCDGQRLPFAPLKRLLRRLLVDEMVGHGGLTWAQADLLAVRVGFHPSEVWGADWWSLEDDEVEYTQDSTTSGGAHG